MWVSTIFIIYGTESYLNTPDLKSNNDNGCVHRTSLSGHSQSIPTNKHLHRTIGHTGHALNSEHAHRTF